MVRPLPTLSHPAPTPVGVVADFREEDWPSMELAAELTLQAIAQHGAEAFTPELLRPALPRLARRVGALRPTTAHNADRYLGRYLAYPAWLRRRAAAFSLFHLVDHSYAHLVHSLPAARCVVTCHDLDAFRSLDGSEARPAWFRATMRRVRSGLSAAAAVVCDSAEVRDALAERGMVAPGRLHLLPLPVHPEFTAAADLASDARAGALGIPPGDGPLLLHVGSDAPRKRIPFLLELFAALRARRPGLRLLRVGGSLEPHRAQVEALGLGGAVAALPSIDRPLLAAVYRSAALVLLPSAREGFGWPLLEALACGRPVLASDLAPLRALGGDAAAFAPVDDAGAWLAAAEALLVEDEAARAARRAAAEARAALHSLPAYAQGLFAVYHRVLAEVAG